MKILKFGQKPKRWANLVVAVLLGLIVIAGGNSSSVKAGDEEPTAKPVQAASEERPVEKSPINDWVRVIDWDGTGEKPLPYQIGGISRSETLPEEYIPKKQLRDLPVGMGGFVREEDLKIDATRHGWLRSDALVYDRFVAKEFPICVTRWGGGYYVYPNPSFRAKEVKGTYKAEDGFIPVKAFCRCEPKEVEFTIPYEDLEHLFKDILKDRDPSGDWFR